jgi:hypothetical protein
MSSRCVRWVGTLIVFAVAAAAAAQSGPTVSDRVRDAMLAQYAAWQLDFSRAAGGQFTQRWKHGAERIVIVYDERASTDDASSWLDTVPVNVSIGGGETLTGVGDGALMFHAFSDSGSATIYLRKGKSTATITAPSSGIATQVAQSVVAQIY